MWPFDEIERVLAQHDGFADEELDFAVNYDVKSRIGRDDGAGDVGTRDRADAAADPLVGRGSG